MADLDIGFWFPRPERGARLAAELRELAQRVTIYHSAAIPGDQSWVREVPYGALSGLRAIRKTHHDVYYTPHSFVPVLQLLANKRLRLAPYVYTLNGAIWAYFQERHQTVPFRRGRKFVYGGLLRAALQGAGAVVTNSSFLGDGLRDRFPALASKVKTIYNGIDYEAIDRANPNPGPWGGGEPRVLSVVTLNFLGKTQGAITLLNAFDAIAARYPDSRLVIAAKSDRPEYVALLDEHRRSLRAASRIAIEPNRRDVPDLLAAADLFLYATREDSSDSLPRVLLEAQAAGVPVVTTDTVGCAEVVLNGKTGLVVEDRSESLADAGLRLLDDRTQAFLMASTGRALVRERFNWREMAASYLDTFRSVRDGA